MDEWDSVRQKLKELESSFLSSSQDVRSTMDDISVADFWKRRYDEDKQLWEQKLASKETEQHKIKEKYIEDEHGITELNFKVKVLEQKLESEKIIWEERSKVKLLEAELEKKKVEYEAKIKILEDENEHLRLRLRRGSETAEEESRRRQLIETEKIRMTEELKILQQQISLITEEEQKKILALEAEKQALQKQLEEKHFAKKDDQEKSVVIEKEISLLSEERNRHMTMLAEREREQFESFENLARGFAHKVRNYLGIMSGTLQLCIANFKMEDELKKQVTLVDQNAQEMLKAIEEFLALAKIPEMSLQPTDIKELVSGILFSCEEAASAQNVTVEKKLSESIPAIPVDNKILTEGLRQLIVNAIEASPIGTTISVSASYESNTNRLLLRITDNGKGISENHIKKIFQPYFTTRKGKKGLGLCIAKRAIDLHHGSIQVASTKDKGTTVTVYLPIQKAQ